MKFIIKIYLLIIYVIKTIRTKINNSEIKIPMFNF